MFDLLLNHGGRLDIKNRQGLTPLTLAAKLARKDVSVVLFHTYNICIVWSVTAIQGILNFKWYLKAELSGTVSDHLYLQTSQPTETMLNTHIKLSPCNSSLKGLVFNGSLKQVVDLFAMLLFQMYEHVLEKERQVFWIFGTVTCAGYPLACIDTISPTGEINHNSALNLIVYGVSFIEF